MFQFIFVITASIFIVWLWFYLRNLSRSNFLQNNPQFQEAKDYTLVPGHHILINDKGYIALKNPKMGEFAVIHVHDIVDLEVVKNSRFHGSIAGSIGGALTFGVVGSIVGSIIAGTDKVHDFGLVFFSNHNQYPSIQIKFLSSKMKQGGIKDKLLSTVITGLLEHLMRLENQ